VGLLGAQVAGDPFGALGLLVVVRLSPGLERGGIVIGIVPRIVEATDRTPHREGLVAVVVAVGWHYLMLLSAHAAPDRTPPSS
jgi:hypothetical protein